jgi:T5orf172 domain-containing protein
VTKRDMGRRDKCHWPQCAPADDHPTLEATCFQTGKRPQWLWPPEIGSEVPTDPCSCDGLERAGWGVVYAIGPDEERPLKIGSAANAVTRRRDLQSGNWRTLFVYRTIFFGPRARAHEAERRLHDQFSEFRIEVKGCREWFEIGLDQFDEAIEALNVRR